MKESQAGAGANHRQSAVAVPRQVFRFQCEALPREADLGAWDWTPLHVGEADAASSRLGEEGAKARMSSSTSAQTAIARHVAAPGRQSSSVVSR